MESAELKTLIDWCGEMGHSEHEILDLIRRIVSANPRISDMRQDVKRREGSEKDG